MKTFGSVDEIFDFAIDRETEAIQLYKDLAARVDKPEMQKVLEDFAEEESEHKAKLEAVRKGELALKEEAVGDLGIVDNIGGGDPRPDMSYADVLVLAMKKEKVSYKLYLDLAAITQDRGLKDMFMLLAQEEAHHKLRFELEYDLTTF